MIKFFTNLFREHPQDKIRNEIFDIVYKSMTKNPEEWSLALCSSINKNLKIKLRKDLDGKNILVENFDGEHVTVFSEIQTGRIIWIIQQHFKSMDKAFNKRCEAQALAKTNLFKAPESK